MQKITPSSSDTTNKVILVTGSSKRIGAGIIRMAHARGYRVIVHYNRSEQEAMQLIAELNTLRADSAQAVHADLAMVNDADALATFVQSIDDCYGRLDALVHNASVFYPTAMATVTHAELLRQWDELFLSNSKAPMLLTHALLPYLTQTNGVVVSILDIHANIPFRGYPLYNMAKASHQMMVKSLALELAPHIRVNGVAPGTNIFPNSADAMVHAPTKVQHQLHTIEQTEQQQIVSSIPLEAVGTPADIAEAVLYLLNAHYVTGHIINVDGGRSLTIGGS